MGYAPRTSLKQENVKMSKFITKDSGERQRYSSGMRRDVQTDKPRYDLLDWSMLKRWAELMGRGAVKYGEHNWKRAETQTELDRFKASALRHCIQWFNGDVDEDHASAVMFNLSGAEMVKGKLCQQKKK
jgi:hypothetical protein